MRIRRVKTSLTLIILIICLLYSIEPSKKEIEGVPVVENYDGKGGDRVLFYKPLDA